MPGGETSYYTRAIGPVHTDYLVHNVNGTIQAFAKILSRESGTLACRQLLYDLFCTCFDDDEKGRRTLRCICCVLMFVSFVLFK